VRPAAQVGERTVAVKGDGLDAIVPHEVLDQLDLVVLALGPEALDRLRRRQLAALERLVGLDVLAHPRLDALEVVLGELDPVRELEVVVKAVLDRRPDRDLHPRVELHHRRGEHVRRVVADEPEGVGVLRGDDLEGTLLERRVEVAQIAVLSHAERGARQTLADRPRGVGAGGAVGELERGAVGKRDLHRGPRYRVACIERARVCGVANGC